MPDLYEPTPEWFDNLAEKVDAYHSAKNEKRYADSDSLRSELTRAGVIDLDVNPRWHPVFESKESRSARLNNAAAHH